MSMPQATPAPAVPPAPPAPGAPGPTATGQWLGSQSVFDQKDERRLGRAVSISLLLHLGLFALLLTVFAVRPDVAKDLQNQVINMVFTPDPRPAGGGGGSPAPAPPKPTAVPPPKNTAAPVPVDVPPPTLNTPVMTNQNLLQATGANSVSLAAYAGGGNGGGIGRGNGNGFGNGNGNGFGDGVGGPGNGISNPQPLKIVPPEYTPDAMRAKITGVALVDAIVNADGTVGDVRIARSLDKVYGLDEKALVAAKKWLFRPATDRMGKPVAVRIQIELQFTLH